MLLSKFLPGNFFLYLFFGAGYFSGRAQMIVQEESKQALCLALLFLRQNDIWGDFKCLVATQRIIFFRTYMHEGGEGMEKYILIIQY